MSSPSAPVPGPAAVPFAPAEQALLGEVGGALADGLALKLWWEQRAAAESYAQRFELSTTFHRPERAVGFFDVVPVRGRPLPVMGVVQEMLYDQPKRATGREVRQQLREFVLHYFLRVSDYREPDVYPQLSQPNETNDLALSWCPRPDLRQAGFGFSQHYFQARGADCVGRFPAGQEFAVVDMRRLGPDYDWIVLKVRIFNFSLGFRPFGPGALALSLPMLAENFLVAGPEFVTDRDDPAPGVVGEYGVGYAFLHDPGDAGLLAYGPGRFEAGFQLITFRVLDSGVIKVRLVFVVNRPGQITNLRIAPLDWGFRLADLFSLGLASRLFGPTRAVLDRLPLRFGSFDPVSAAITAVNVLSAGWAASELCVSREQLEKDFLVHHFRQHYQMIVGSLLTWRQIPDWLDAANLPDFVVTGVSS